MNYDFKNSYDLVVYEVSCNSSNINDKLEIFSHYISAVSKTEGKGKSQWAR